MAPGVQEAGGLAEGVQEAGLGAQGQELVAGGREAESGGAGGGAGRPGQWQRVALGVRVGLQERGERAAPAVGVKAARRPREQWGNGGRRAARGAEGGSPPGRARWWARRGRQEEGEALRGVQEEGERYRGEQEQPPGTWPPRRREAGV